MRQEAAASRRFAGVQPRRPFDRKEHGAIRRMTHRSSNNQMGPFATHGDGVCADLSLVRHPGNEIGLACFDRQSLLGVSK
jgi:hypothetical protein